MNKLSVKYILLFVAVNMLLTSCFKDLDTLPKDPNVETSANVYKEKSNYKKVLAKLYAGLAVSGQKGPAGKPDISGQDEGYGQYLRAYFYAQEYTTDEAVIGWGDATIRDFHNQSWTSQDGFISSLYYRLFFQITATNEFLRETTMDKLAERGHDSDADFVALVKNYRAEARFLRALSYFHAIDMFANVPFVTENDKVGSFFPKQISRTDLFDYLESELTAIEEDMPVRGSVEYGRADQSAAWTLLTKLYLNAKVYTGTERWSDAAIAAKKVIDNGGYTLHDNYAELFMADNSTNGAQNEIIFPIMYDGLTTKTFGGTSFIIKAGIGGSMSAEYYGVDGGWGGHRTTSALVKKFDFDGDYMKPLDSRALFYVDTPDDQKDPNKEYTVQSLEINDLSNFTQGFAVAKFSNRTSTGGLGKAKDFVDTDFPVFRLADVYLMYVEARFRAGQLSGSDMEYINAVRERGLGSNAPALTVGNITERLLIDERARELFFECHRRTDLIRFGMFSETNYLWPWKGGEKDGKSVDKKYDLFPIPSDDLAANPNLDQNPGF